MYNQFSDIAVNKETRIENYIIASRIHVYCIRILIIITRLYMLGFRRADNCVMYNRIFVTRCRLFPPCRSFACRLYSVRVNKPARRFAEIYKIISLCCCRNVIEKPKSFFVVHLPHTYESRAFSSSKTHNSMSFVDGKRICREWKSAFKHG